LFVFLGGVDGAHQPVGDCKLSEFIQTLARESHEGVGATTLKIIAIFCGAGLSISLLAATYGVDLSPGFF
jgi:hypothetical protein